MGWLDGRSVAHHRFRGCPPVGGTDANRPPSPRARTIVGGDGHVRTSRHHGRNRYGRARGLFADMDVLGSRNPSRGGRPSTPRPTLATPARRARSWAVVALAVVLAGCASPVGSPPPGSPSPSGTTGDGSEAISHPTGRTDLVLREEVGGGFVPIWFFATQAPFFSLYGDGTLIYRDESAPLPDPGPDGIVRGHPFRRAKLSEEQVQELLRFALTEGGLALARPRYDAANVADAPTTTFTIRAGGLDKTVAVYALGLESAESADVPARRALARLDERLRSLITSGTLRGELWTPDRWRGTLTEGGAAGPARTWPWATVAPTDFVADPNGEPPVRRRTMAPAEVEALGLTGIEGGFHGLLLEGPDGTTYSFGLRPLLPDEAA